MNSFVYYGRYSWFIFWKELGFLISVLLVPVVMFFALLSLMTLYQDHSKYFKRIFRVLFMPADYYRRMEVSKIRYISRFKKF